MQQIENFEADTLEEMEELMECERQELEHLCRRPAAIKHFDFCWHDGKYRAIVLYEVALRI